MNLYELFSIPSDTNVATIQQAFIELSRLLHPVKVNAATIPPGGETNAECKVREQRNHERYIKIVEAYNILTDATKRRDYDEQERRKKNLSTDKSSKPAKENQPQSTAPETRADPDQANNNQGFLAHLQDHQLLLASIAIGIIVRCLTYQYLSNTFP
ncbi:hypothetical protein CHU98_g6949 [Xylaria longipes]|nr:hypothetical protein CHU98_g6949 [Xylaria longipes]